MIANNKRDLVRMVHDPFVRAALAARVGWSPSNLVVGGIYLAAILRALVTPRRNPKQSAIILFAATGITVSAGALSGLRPRSSDTRKRLQSHSTNLCAVAGSVISPP